MSKNKPRYFNEVELSYISPKLDKHPQIRNAKGAVKVIRDFYNVNQIDLKEFYWLILLSHSNHVLGVAEIGVGNSKKVLANPKEVFQLALKINASGIIIAHNHPTSANKPIASKEDIDHTEQMKTISNLLDIELVDSLILSKDSYYSFAAEKKI